MTASLPQIPDYAFGVCMAVVSLFMFGVCMILVSVVMRRLGSEPGSLLSAGVGVPVGLAIVTTQAVSGHLGWPDSWRTVAFFAIAGVLSTYLGRWLVFKSIETIGPSGASALQSTSPLITALFAWVFLGEHIGWLGVLGITLAIAGLAGTSMGLSRNADAKGVVKGGARTSMIFSLAIFGLASSAAYSGSHVFRAAAIRSWNEPLAGGAIGAVAGLSALLFASRKRLPRLRAEILANRSAALIYLGIGVLQFLAQSLVIGSMKYIPASLAALLSMCTPLVVMPMSYFLLRNQEKLNPVTVMGILVTLGGTMLTMLTSAHHA